MRISDQKAGILPVHVTPCATNTRIRKISDCIDPGETIDIDNVKVTYLRKLDDAIRLNEKNKVKDIILVCECRKTAEKAFLYYMKTILKSRPFVERDEEFPFELGSKLDDEIRGLYEDMTEPNTDIYEVSLETVSEKSKIPGNLYLSVVITELDKETPYLLVGFQDNEDIKDKVDALRALSGGVFRFIWIRPEQMHSPWVLDLVLSDGFVTLKVDEPSDELYLGMLKEQLKCSNVSLEEGIDPMEVILVLKRKFGDHFDEQILWTVISQGVMNAKGRGGNKKHRLTLADLIPGYDPSDSAFSRLDRMIGHKNVKEMITESVAFRKEQIRNKRLSCIKIRNNMIFCGNPGTGKTTIGELYSAAVAETGGSNGIFVNASREDLIGKYVGHTASKIAGKFREARGGVLFIDEAGFFIGNDTGGFIHEAIKEIVRYMENTPDVTVIFGMYEREVEGFLAMDEGLRSRISRIIRFADYSDEELLKIAELMCEDRGYRLDKNCHDLIAGYIGIQRKKDDFGNAREIRRLIDNSVRAHSVSMFLSSRDGEQVPADPDVISPEDIRGGMERSGEDVSEKKNSVRMGFGVVDQPADIPETVCLRV